LKEVRRGRRRSRGGGGRTNEIKERKTRKRKILRGKRLDLMSKNPGDTKKRVQERVNATYGKRDHRTNFPLDVGAGRGTPVNRIFWALKSQNSRHPKTMTLDSHTALKKGEDTSGKKEGKSRLEDGAGAPGGGRERKKRNFREKPPHSTILGTSRYRQRRGIERDNQKKEETSRRRVLV